MAFSNLICYEEQKQVGATEHDVQQITTLRTNRDKFAFEICEIGAKAVRLKENATMLLSTEDTQVTVVTELPTYVKADAVDYVNTRAILTVCRLLRHAKESCAELPRTDTADGGATEHASGKDNAVFQLNHVRILEPAAGDNIFTKQRGRLLPNVRVIDSTGALDLRMWGKAALSISGQDSKEAFANLALTLS